MKKVLILLTMIFVSSANAAVIYDEAIDGDAAAVIGTDLGVLAAGENIVIGTSPGNFDDDWYKFTIDVDSILDSIILLTYSGPGGNLGWANGSSIVLDHTGPVNTSYIGNDLLEFGGLASIPDFLGAGTYAVKIGTGTNQNAYSFAFNVSKTSVPEPMPFLLLGIGLLGLGFARSRAAVK